MLPLHMEVIALVREGRFADAVARAEKSCKAWPEDHNAWGVLSHALEIAGKTSKALEAASEASRLAPLDVSDRFQHGRLLLLAGRSEAAAAELRSTIELEKLRSESNYLEIASLLLAEALRRCGRHAEALDALKPVAADFKVFQGSKISHASIFEFCTDELAKAKKPKASGKTSAKAPKKAKPADIGDE